MSKLVLTMQQNAGLTVQARVVRLELNAKGMPGPAGPPGPPGTDGKSVLNGVGAPGAGVGVDGDFYLDTATEELYGPKTAGVWPLPPVSLVGPAGAPGADGKSVLNGTGAPSNALGNDGDFYIDTATNELYGPKAAGVWPAPPVSLVGPAGPPGPSGVVAATAPITYDALTQTVGIDPEGLDRLVVVDTDDPGVTNRVWFPDAALIEGCIDYRLMSDGFVADETNGWGAADPLPTINVSSYVPAIYQQARTINGALTPDLTVTPVSTALGINIPTPPPGAFRITMGVGDFRNQVGLGNEVNSANIVIVDSTTQSGYVLHHYAGNNGGVTESRLYIGRDDLGLAVLLADVWLGTLLGDGDRIALGWDGGTTWTGYVNDVPVVSINDTTHNPATFDVIVTPVGGTGLIWVAAEQWLAYTYAGDTDVNLYAPNAYHRVGGVWEPLLTGPVDGQDIASGLVDPERLGTGTTSSSTILYGDSVWRPDNSTVIPAATGEPMGHKDRAESVIAFDNGLREFSITPVATTFEVWVAGTKFDSVAQSVSIPNTTGLYYFYFDTAGVLQYKTTYFDWPVEAPTAYVYWNQTTGQAEFFADERHGITLDWATHEYLHRTRGAAFATGFSVGGYTLGGPGNVDTDAQADLSDGTFFDEDLEVDVVSTATPTPGTWEQDLLFPMKVPVFYLSGSSWVRDVATSFPLKQGAVRPAYNLNTAGVWTTPDAANGKYVISWLVATNNLDEPVVAILSQGEYSSLNTARNVAWDSLQLPGFPVFEFRPLYKLIFLTQTTMANTPKASLADIQDLRGGTSAGSGTVVSDHGLLAGLADDDHTQYALADGSRGSFLRPSNNLSDVASVSTARTNLGLGTSAVLDAQTNLQSSVAYLDGSGLVQPGIIGNYASTPDAAVLDITGDIELVVRVSQSRWVVKANQAFITKREAGTNRHSYWFGSFNGTLTLTWYDGTTTRFVTTTVSLSTVPFIDNTTYWLKATLDVDNGSGQRVVTFYWAADSPTEPTVWTTLQTFTTAGVTQIAPNSAPLEFGSERLAGGFSTNLQPMPSKVYRGIVRNGIGGTVVCDAVFSAAPAMALSFTESSANAATVTVTQARVPASTQQVVRGDDDRLYLPKPALWIRENFTDADVVSNARTSMLYAQTGTLTAPRTFTLPASATYGTLAQEIAIWSGTGVSATNTITVQGPAGETINGSATSYVISQPNRLYRFMSQINSAGSATNPSWVIASVHNLTAAEVSGLGSAALLNVGTSAGTVAAGDDSRITGAVQSTIVDAKGDLLVGTAADTVARLPVGTDNYVLTADASTTEGVKWAAASGGTPIPGIFGTGEDGNVTIAANTTLVSQTTASTQWKQYENLTINAGVTVTLTGGIIFVKGTLTLNGTLANNGGNATGTTTGGGSSSNGPYSMTTPNQGANSGTGVGQPGSPTTNPLQNMVFAFGGAGGAGGSGASGAGGASGVAPAISNTNSDAQSRMLTVLTSGILMSRQSNPLFQGGSGRGGGSGAGDGTNSGAPGGGGGGCTIIIANRIAGTGTIECKGGNGNTRAVGNCGGGGGGGGGFIGIVTNSTTQPWTLVVTGGTGGAGIGTGTAGGNGSNGNTVVMLGAS